MTAETTSETAASPLFLVTGAAGFVGSHLVQHLAGEGIRVRAMVRGEAQAAPLKSLVDEIVFGDLTRPETLGPAVEGVAGIYHIAALFRQANVGPEAFQAVNVDGVRNILDAAVAAGVPRFVHCSTNGVHSHIEHPPADEDYPFDPSDPYQVSKLEGEQIVMEYFREGKISGAVIRPTMIWGPGDTRTRKMFRMIKAGRFFYVGPGEALNHWIDVRDLARAFRLAMERTDVDGEVFLIGGRKYLPLRVVADEIADQLGVKRPSLHLPVAPIMSLAHATEIACKPFGLEPPLYRRRVSFFLKHRAYDISRARKRLGFEPRQDLAGEIADIIESYRREGQL